MAGSATTSDGAETRRRILDAAAELFFASGYHATSVRDIAAHVGIKAGSIYNHFSGKQLILREIGSTTSTQLHEGAVARLAGASDPEEQLRIVLRWHVEFHCHHQLWCRVTDTQLEALEVEHRDVLVGIRDDYEQLIRDILVRGREEKAWHIPELSVVSIGIETMCNEVAGWYRPDGRLTPDKIAEILTDFVISGLSSGSSSAVRPA
jgi:AcrR family transcriptional regulator